MGRPGDDYHRMGKHRDCGVAPHYVNMEAAIATVRGAAHLYVSLQIPGLPSHHSVVIPSIFSY